MVQLRWFFPPKTLENHQISTLLICQCIVAAECSLAVAADNLLSFFCCRLQFLQKFKSRYMNSTRVSYRAKNAMFKPWMKALLRS